MPRAFYRTKDRRADYEFSFERQTGGDWRAYILDQPSYGSRDEGADATHRYTDNGRHYICWNRAIRSEADVHKVAALWADCTQEYIRSGKRFG